MKNTYIKAFVYKKPNEEGPSDRYLLVLEEDRNYLRGIDLHYLTLAEAYYAIKHIRGQYHVGKQTSDMIALRYPQFNDAWRCFRKDRILMTL